MKKKIFILLSLPLLAAWLIAAVGASHLPESTLSCFIGLALALVMQEAIGKRQITTLQDGAVRLRRSPLKFYALAFLVAAGYAAMLILTIYGLP